MNVKQDASFSHAVSRTGARWWFCQFA